MTASAPAPSALRRTAPRLPGFSTPSMTTTSASGGSAGSSRSRSVGGMRATATRPSARSPNAILARTASVHRPDLHAERAQAVERGARVRAGQLRFAHERLDDLDAGVERPAQLARTVDQRQAGPFAIAPVAQGGRRGHPRVGETRDHGRGRGGHPRHHDPPDDRAKAPRSRRRPSAVARIEVTGIDIGRRTPERRPDGPRPAGPDRTPACAR